MQSFPVLVVVIGSALAVWTWFSPHGLPRLGPDRLLAEHFGTAAMRAVEFALALLLVALGVAGVL